MDLLIAIKFMDNHCDDEKLIKRIYGKYHQLIHIKKQKLHLKVEKCKKTIVGDYRIIYFVNGSFNKKDT